MGSNTRSPIFLAALPTYGGASRGEFDATLQAGDFLFVPAWLPHQEINPSSEKPFQWIVVRNTSEPIVVNMPDDFWGDIDLGAPHLRVEG
jgi:uncharacterized RmlC-like cupin family protein